MQVVTRSLLWEATLGSCYGSGMSFRCWWFRAENSGVDSSTAYMELSPSDTFSDGYGEYLYGGEKSNFTWSSDISIIIYNHI